MEYQKEEIQYIQFTDGTIPFLLPSNGINNQGDTLLRGNSIGITNGENSITFQCPSITNGKPNRNYYYSPSGTLTIEVSSEFPIDLTFGGVYKPSFTLNWDSSVTLGNLSTSVIPNAWGFGNVNTWDETLFRFNQITEATWEFSDFRTIKLYLKHS